METKTFQARHEQVANWLRQQIKSGKFKINAQLPSESELCRQFEVSRVTVRHALRTLETENMISRRQGVGSFVKPQPMRHPLMKVTDFAEDMAQAGLTASSLVLRFETDQPPAKIRELLGVPEGQLTIRLDRIRFGNERPIAFDTTWLPLMYGHFLDGQDLTQRTLFQILEQTYGIEVLAGRYQIDAVLAPAEVATHLNVSTRDPLLLIRRTVFTRQNKALYVQDRYYNSRDVGYCMMLSREQEDDENGLNIQDFQPMFKSEDDS